jgi:hypothetical protein
MNIKYVECAFLRVRCRRSWAMGSVQVAQRSSVALYEVS